jgi:peptide/nickel transport system permease protein
MALDEAMAVNGAYNSPMRSSLRAQIRSRIGRLWRAGGLRLLPLGLIVAIAVAGPWLVPYDPIHVVGPASVPPGAMFWFGTDSSGLDVFSQTLVATRTDLAMALLVVCLASGIGVALGLVLGMNESAGGLRGLAARGLGRIIDFVQALPAIVIALIAVTFYGANIVTLIGAVSIILCPIQMRLVRTEVLRVRSDAYLDAARVAGLSEFELTLRHVLPNSCWPALENVTVLLGTSIILMAALGFLGVGLPPPAPEWGSMISRGASEASSGRWWAAGFPTLALALTVASVVLSSAVLFPKRRGH